MRILKVLLFILFPISILILIFINSEQTSLSKNFGFTGKEGRVSGETIMNESWFILNSGGSITSEEIELKAIEFKRLVNESCLDSSIVKLKNIKIVCGLNNETIINHPNIYKEFGVINQKNLLVLEISPNNLFEISSQLGTEKYIENSGNIYKKLILTESLLGQNIFSYPFAFFTTNGFVSGKYLLDIKESSFVGVD